MRTYTCIVAVAVVLAGTIGSADVTFTETPHATRVGDSTRVEFAVSGPTDVTVRIENAAGETVRHLAAGMLGDNAPVPLKPGALQQAVDWDGNDDAGRPADGGPFTARVSIGLSPVFDKIIGWSGQHIDAVRGLSCGPDGTLYLVYGGQLYAHRQTTLISAFDRKGQYVRQVFPGPANLPPEKRRGWPRVKLGDGGEVPVVHHLLPRTTYPGAVFDNRVFPVTTSDGRLIVLSGAGETTNKYPDLRGGRRLLILGTDGSVPQDFLRPEICPFVGGFGHIALSPDDRYVYATGFVDTGRNGKGPCQVVYRVALDGSEPSRIIIGKLYGTGGGESGLNDPQGIATDTPGNIYVADYGNNRIAVFEPGGAYLDEIPVAYPDGLHVSRKTGAVYVMQLKERRKPFDDQHYYVPAHNWRADRVIKFASLKDKQEQASFENTLVSNYGGGAHFAIDESDDEPIVWLTGLTYGGGPVLRIADKGDLFELLDSPLAGAGQDYRGEHLGFFGDVAVVGDKVITRHPAFGMHTNASFVYSADTGEFVGTYVPQKEDGQPENMWTLLYGEMVAGRDGSLYVHARNNVIRRYDAEGKQLPFTSTGTNFIEGFWHGHTRPAGMFIDSSGTIYVPAAAENRKLEDMTVRVVGPDGKVRNEHLLEIHGARVGGIAVDRQGNVYLGAQVAPRDGRIPEWFAGRLPADSEAGHPSNDYKQYGMVFKFPPDGGRIRQDADGPFVAHCQYKGATVSVDGALWMRRLGYIGVHGEELGCHCETTRFDVDDFGRLFVPDVFRFCVYVLDGQGNEITRFGSFGNMDSRGPDGPVPEPAVTFGWPLSVELAGERAFVADTVNRRVVAVRLAYAATSECRLPDPPRLPLLRLILRADGSGNLAAMRLNQTALEPGDYGVLRKHLIAILGDDRGPKSLQAEAELEIDCDQNLRYEHVIDAVAAVSSYVGENDDVVKLIRKIKFVPHAFERSPRPAPADNDEAATSPKREPAAQQPPEAGRPREAQSPVSVEEATQAAPSSAQKSFAEAKTAGIGVLREMQRVNSQVAAGQRVIMEVIVPGVEFMTPLDQNEPNPLYLKNIPAGTPQRIWSDLFVGTMLWSKCLLPGQLLYELERDADSSSTTVTEAEKKRMCHWGNSAKSLLSGAIESSRSTGTVTPKLAHATLSLAQIHMWLGLGRQSVALLEDDRIGPLMLVERNSPAVFSSEYIRETYKVAIRAYHSVGRRQDADRIRKSLGEIADARDTTPIAIYEPSTLNIETQQRD